MYTSRTWSSCLHRLVRAKVHEPENAHRPCAGSAYTPPRSAQISRRTPTSSVWAGPVPFFWFFCYVFFFKIWTNFKFWINFEIWMNFKFWTNFEIWTVSNFKQILKSEWISNFEQISKFEWTSKFMRIFKWKQNLNEFWILKANQIWTNFNIWMNYKFQTNL
jgi:hypothetical protein